MKLSNNLSFLIYAKYLISVIPKLIEKVELQKNELTIVVKPHNLYLTIQFLKNHINCQFNSLIDICGVDYLNKSKRFEIGYRLLSIKYNSRICVKTNTDEMTPIMSINTIFKSAS